LFVSWPAGFPPVSDVPQRVTSDSSAPRCSPLFPSTMWSAVQGARAASESGRCRRWNNWRSPTGRRYTLSHGGVAPTTMVRPTRHIPGETSNPDPGHDRAGGQQPSPQPDPPKRSRPTERSKSALQFSSFRTSRRCVVA
jgi:hypothetical protein